MAKRILFINTVVTGSHGRIVSDLAEAARNAGNVEFETEFAYGRGDDSPERIGGPLDGAAHLLSTRLFDAHGFGSVRATKALVKRLKAHPPDLVHLHNVHGYYLNIEILFEYLKASGIPVVWTLHDCWAFTGHCSHFVRAKCFKWQKGCEHCPMKREYPTSLLLDNSKSNYNRKKAAFTGHPNLSIVTPSEWLAKLVNQSFLKDYPVSTIPNGVDLTVFAPTDMPQAKRPLILAVAAPFDKRKGFEDTLKIAQSIPEADMIMVGLTPKQIASLPKGSAITGLTRTENRDELVSLYRRASVLLNTTYEDTYPTVNMEAMACGLPVACYSVGGCPEQITYQTGALTPVGDVSALINAARRIIAQPRDEFKAACRARAEAAFDRKAAMRRYISLYKSILE
ncbi:glycosyl transferase [Clostridia bacterium]|nr:glycosyl transferase [Clostridia bacterium]